MTSKSVWAPVALAAVVVAVVAGVTAAAHVGRSPSSTRPALLHLGAGGAQGMALGAPVRTGSSRSGGSPYVLDTPLPTEQPADQPVWRLVAADAAAATRVARALALDGTPTPVHGGWVLRARNQLRLAVRDDGSWSYGMDCLAGQPISEETLDVMCASTTGVATGSATGSAPAPPAGPSAADARAQAAPILRKLGLDGARLTVSAGSPTTTVQASYDVDGISTVGLATTLSFAADGSLATGDGWLTTVRKGDRYPVITAKRAFELLQQRPRPMLEMCMRRPDGKPGCADIPPTVITGATLGLALAHDGQRPTLVPAWLFRVKGQEEPLSQVAVQPSYLAPPDTRPLLTPEGVSPA